MYKEDLALNNLQWLICHKTKPTNQRSMMMMMMMELQGRKVEYVTERETSDNK